MATYTHAFIYSTKQVVTLEELRDILRGNDLRARGSVSSQGFLVISDLDRVVWDQHGRPSRNGGGWSYGHVQYGWICAGAGGLNSLRLVEIA